MRRAYFECRYGQLHVRDAMSAGGGFDEGTTLLCLHQGPLAGRLFQKFLPLMGTDRSVYAPDLPGDGESDAPPAPPSIADYAGALADFLADLRFRQVDLLGFHVGAAIATELAVSRASVVRRLVLVGVPILAPEQQAAYAREPTPAAAADTAGSRGRRAVAAYPMRERLSQVQQPVLVLRPRDELWEATARARETLRGAKFEDFADSGRGLFEAAPERVAALAREFLGR
jgi:pimeloyl-ACP methyl ester carboxylesterase